MCSRSSSSALLLTLALLGCRASVEPPAPPPRPAYVDVAALVQRHPLLPELARLREVRAVPRGEPVPGAWEGVLRALPAGGVPSGVERAALEGAVERARREAQGRGIRQHERLVAQRRAELVAAERNALQARERELRQRAEQSLRRATREQTAVLGELRTAEQLYRSQLRDGVAGRSDLREQASEVGRLRPLSQPLPNSTGQLRERVERLKGPTGFRPAPRSRMLVMADTAAGAHRALSEELDARWESGRREVEAAVARARSEAALRVERRLAALTGPPRGSELEERVRSRAARALTDEAALRGRRGIGSPERRQRVAAVSGVGPPAPGTASRSALLAALIEQDVAARVRDAAQRQRLALRATPSAGVPDRTAQVGGWVGFP